MNARQLSKMIRAVVVALAAFADTAVGHAVAPVVTGVSPNPFIQNFVPQPTITITGANFVAGFPIQKPTVTLKLQSDPTVEYSMVSTTANTGGTTLTCAAGANTFNLLNAPAGLYDVTVTRPDGQSGTLVGGFTIAPEQFDGIHLTRTGTWGGPVTDIEVQGDLAYLANGRALRILNIANPAQPIELGVIDLVGVSSVEVRDGYAFVAAAPPYRFCVVDVSNPAAPRLIWVSAGTGASTSLQDVHLHGNIAYVRGLGLTSLEAFDITDPHNVVFQGSLVSIGSSAVAATIAGSRLYVGTNSSTAGGGNTSEMRIYDLAANPLNPPFLGSVVSPNDGWFTTSLSVEGDSAAWVVQNQNTPPSLFKVDVSNPAAPVILGSATNSTYPTAVSLSNGRAYVAETALDPAGWASVRGLVVLDVAGGDPSLPFLGAYKPHGSVIGVKVFGNRAYVFDEGEGLIILDVSNPARPVRIGGYHSPAILRKAAKSGDLLFVSDMYGGFTILDVADPAHPQLVGNYLAEHVNNLGVDAFGIAVRDNHVFLSAGHLGLEAIDVSNPSNPVRVGAFRIPPPSTPSNSLFSDLAMADDFARVGFLDCVPGGCATIILNVNVANPLNMFEVGRTLAGSGGPPWALTAGQNGLLFSNDSEGPNRTFDCSDPANPHLIYTGNAIDAVDCALDGQTLFIADNDDEEDGFRGLWVQDVSNPTNPVVLTTINQSTNIGLTHYPSGAPVQMNRAQAVAVQNHRLYMVGGASGAVGTYVVNVADPANPIFENLLKDVAGINDSSFISLQSASILADEPQIFVTTGSRDDITNYPTPIAALNGTGLVILTVNGLPISHPGDITGDGHVNVNDLLAVISSWGPCPMTGPCPADIAPSPNGDSVVNVNDLLMVIANWG